MTSGEEPDPVARRRPPTLYDVAELANVSHQTVSRLVKGHTNIRPELRKRVEDAIEELNYKPNMVARSLATRRSHRIGALVYELLEVGPSKTIQGASAGAREAGYLLDIVSLDPRDDQAIEQSISLINQNELAGILVSAPTDRVIRALANVQFAVPVYIDAEANELPDSTAPTLNELGVMICIDHLRHTGHRRFFQISGPRDWLATQGRAHAYESGLLSHGLVSVGSIEGDWSAESGYGAAMRMPLDRGITALVAENDQMALGAMTALQERGVAIPDDISVVGFDDIPEARFFRPSLTTVHVEFARQGRIAIDRLLGMITGEGRTPRLEPLMPELVVRASTGPASTR